MKLLFENWRKYLTEATDPDSDADDAAELRDIADDIEIEVSDEEKIFNAFLDSGTHGLHLAEMTDSPEAGEIKSIVHDVHEYISFIEDPPVSTIQQMLKRLDRDSDGISIKIFELAERSLHISIDLPTLQLEQFEDMLVEAGDYLWWHGRYANQSPMYNLASKEKSSDMLDALKKWAGV